MLAMSAEDHRRARYKWQMLSYKVGTSLSALPDLIRVTMADKSCPQALTEYMDEIDLRPYKRIPADVDIDLAELVLKWHRMVGVIMAVEKSRARDVFRLLDGDRDGKLRRKEMYAAARHFELGFNPYEVGTCMHGQLHVQLTMMACSLTRSLITWT